MAYLETHEADIIFMDCLMSEMDGFATTRRIKNMNTYNHTPVIALTANTMKEYKVLKKRYGWLSCQAI
ncbi:MAG: response regulator [Lentisphaerales bacterium]|nr:response regulator [Lentisphaerales bacterium]